MMEFESFSDIPKFFKPVALASDNADDDNASTTTVENATKKVTPEQSCIAYKQILLRLQEDNEILSQMISNCDRESDILSQLSENIKDTIRFRRHYMNVSVELETLTYFVSNRSKLQENINRQTNAASIKKSYELNLKVSTTGNFHRKSIQTPTRSCFTASGSIFNINSPSSCGPASAGIIDFNNSMILGPTLSMTRLRGNSQSSSTPTDNSNSNTTGTNNSENNSNTTGSLVKMTPPVTKNQHRRASINAPTAPGLVSAEFSSRIQSSYVKPSSFAMTTDAAGWMSESTMAFALEEPNCSDKTYFTFLVKKASKTKFWATTSRVLHVDLSNKQVCVTKHDRVPSSSSSIHNSSSRSSISEYQDFAKENNNSNINTKQTSPIQEATSEVSITLHAIESSPHSTHQPSPRVTVTKNVARSARKSTVIGRMSEMHHLQKSKSNLKKLKSQKNIHITQSSTDDASVILVDFFKDIAYENGACLVFKSLKSWEEEHDQLIFKSYTFLQRSDLVECALLISKHVLGIKCNENKNKNSNNVNSDNSAILRKRYINTRKLSNIDISIHLDDSAARVSRRLAKLWMEDGSKNTLLRIEDQDPKRLKLWFTQNAKFIACSLIKIFIMLGCIIHDSKKVKDTYHSNVHKTLKRKKLAIDVRKTPELRWLAAASARHIYSLWLEREWVNRYVNGMETMENNFLNHGLQEFDQVKLDIKSKLIEENLIIMQGLYRDGFVIKLPKNLQSYVV